MKLVVAVLLVSAVGFAKPPVKNVRGMRSKLETVRQRKHQVQKELHRTKRELGLVVEDIRGVETRITGLEHRRKITAANLVAARIEQAQARRELAETQKKLEGAKGMVVRRFRTMYKSQSPTMLSAIMGAQSVGDIASRQLLFQKVSEKDHQVFSNYRELSVLAKIRQDRVTDLVKHTQSLAEEQKQQEADLSHEKVKKKEYMGELQDRKGELEELLDKFERDERDIEDQIHAYMASQGNSRNPVRLPPAGRLSAPVSAPITSTFGMRYHPILHITRLHAGVDFGASYGTTIHAAADGVVISATRMSGFGNVVIVDHGNGLSTVYAHCSRIFVHSGQSVRRGQGIAAVGATGLATAPHLHFEVRVNGHAVNPLTKM
ncbi:MAG: peptidoglycan DD-metalloendopeptidase family protein [Armatimonadetes bacterium]|nr:peptidoglycan DD-metalloendopeptidase family protein [Armatimonadota bacterium]